jgi:hypothetical protein
MSGRTQNEHDEYSEALEQAGWRVQEVDGGYAYVAPDCKGWGEGGQCGTDFYWEAEEAMDVAGR